MFRLVPPQICCSNRHTTKTMINLRRNRTFGPAGSRQGREEIGEYIRGSLWVLPGTAVLVALIAGSVLSLVPVPRDGLQWLAPAH